MDSKKQAAVLNAFEHLSKKQFKVCQSLSQLDRHHLFLPPSTDIKQPLNTVIDIITRLYKYSDRKTVDPVRYGFIQVSEPMAEAIKAFNRAKLQFKQSVLEFKGYDNNNNRVHAGKQRQLNKLLTAALKNHKQASILKGTSIGELDLKVCYRQIRVLHPSLESINFMQEKRHIRSHQVSRSMLIDMIASLPESDQLGPYLALNQSTSTHFAIAKNTSMRIMANFTWSNKDLALPRTSPISTLVVGTGNPPSIDWIAKNTKNRKTRDCKRINLETPFIPILSCYEYC